jgi:phage terminase small subunit
MAYLNTKEGRTVSTNHKGRKLTHKMISFIDAYFGEANFNALQAMRLSAYKCTTEASVVQNAAELMTHPLVIEEIKRRQAVRTEKAEVKAEYLINKLMQIIEAEQTDNPQAALRAIELAGKSIALWKERQELSGIDGAAIQHEQHVKESVAEFTSRITGLAKRSGTDNVVEFPGRGSPSGT